MNSIGGNDIEVGFTIVTIIDRFWQYYLINMIVPSFMLVIISFITFIIPASGVDSRIALNMTLFLSLTALQFGKLCCLGASDLHTHTHNR